MNVDKDSDVHAGPFGLRLKAFGIVVKGGCNCNYLKISKKLINIGCTRSDITISTTGITLTFLIGITDYE